MNRFKILSLAVLLITLVGCFNPPEFSSTPEIAFNSVTKFVVFDPNVLPSKRRDSLAVTIDYKDGDGDLGESADARANTKYNTWGNYEIKTFQLVNGEFQELLQAADSKIFFDDLKSNRVKGPIEGKLNYSKTYPQSKSAKNTIIKFQIRIRDRSMNVSNIIETDTVTVAIVR